jgi:hypothetical protein
MLHLKNFIDLPKEDGWMAAPLPPYPVHLGIRFLEQSTQMFVSVSVETVPNPYCEELKGMTKPYLHVAFSKGDRRSLTKFPSGSRTLPRPSLSKSPA